MKAQLWLLLLFVFTSSFSQNNKRKLDSLAQLVDKARGLDEKVGFMGQLALAKFSTGATEDGEKLYQEAAALAAPLKDGAGLALMYHSRGTMFYYMSEYDSALKHYERGLELRLKANDRLGVLKSYNNIAGIYYMFNEHRKALTYYEKALRIEEELGVAEGTYLALNNIGTVYTSLKMYDRAIAIFRKCLNLYKGSLTSLEHTHTGLGMAFKALEKEDSAAKYIKLAVQEARELGDPSALAYALVNIGSFYNHFNHRPEAIDSYREAFSFGLSDPFLQTAIAGNLAAVFLEMGQEDSAFKYMDEVVKLEKEHKIEKHQIDLSRIYATYYYHKKQYDKSFEYWKIYDTYRDSIYNLETLEQINEMQEKYQTERKEKENQLLQAENRSVRAVRNSLIVILALALAGIAGGIFAFRKIRRANGELREQKQIVTEKQKEILDSIRYAKRIQYTLLASENLLSKYLPEHFILFKPKDVVSGDFYWATPIGDKFMMITADCTGHGVPGAFMSLLNISKLSQAVIEKGITRPDLVLAEVRSEIVRSLSPSDDAMGGRDGMDATLCLFDFKSMILQWAGANNPVYILRKGNLLEGKADKMPVGRGHDDHTPFTLHEEKLEKNDIVYTTTDGFADQFGGPAGKKFKFKKLEELLVSISNKSMSDQKEILLQSFESWRGQLEQVDDVCIAGVRIL